jgi:hypothetical protein
MAIALAAAVLSGAFYAGITFGTPARTPDVVVQNEPAPAQTPAAWQEPAAAPQPGNAATDKADVQPGELTPDALPGAVSLPMPAGPELVLIPADPGKPRAEQTEWRYVPIFRLEDARYDADKRLLLGGIDARLSNATRERIQARLLEVTGAPASTVFRLVPVRIQTLALELAVGPTRTLIWTEQAGHDIASGTVPVLHRVKDDEQHELLSSHFKHAALKVRTTSPYAAFARSTFTVEHAVSAIRHGIEKVLPKGMTLAELEQRPLIVDRHSAVRLQQALREDFRVRVEGDLAKLTAFDKVVDHLLKVITVSEVPLHEVTREMIDQVLVWNSATMRLDVAPNERTTLTRELEEANETRSACRHAWDTMREEARKAQDHKAWHKTLFEKMKLDARLRAGIAVFSASASVNLEKERLDSDQGSDARLREYFEKMKNAGEMSQEHFAKSYRNFKGEDWAKSTAGKILNLQRLTKFNVLSVRSALLEYVERVGRGPVEKVTILPLEDSYAQQRDALWEISVLKKECQSEVRALKHTCAQLRKGLDQALAQLPVGTIVPFVGDPQTLPATWQVADGSPLKDTESPLKALLKDGRVPNLNGKFLRGACHVSELLKEGGQAKHDLMVQLGVNLDTKYGFRKDNVHLGAPNGVNDPRTYEAFVTGSHALWPFNGDMARPIVQGLTEGRTYGIPTLPPYCQTMYIIKVR